jgi:hypothetical protein
LRDIDETALGGAKRNLLGNRGLLVPSANAAIGTFADRILNGIELVKDIGESGRSGKNNQEIGRFKGSQNEDVGGQMEVPSRRPHRKLVGDVKWRAVDEREGGIMEGEKERVIEKKED